MKLFTQLQQAALDERSAMLFKSANDDAQAIIDSILPDTVVRFKEESMIDEVRKARASQLIGQLGVGLVKSLQGGKTYPLTASVSFYAVDAHKLVAHRDLLNEFRLAFYHHYTIQPEDSVVSVRFRFTANAIPTLKRLDYPTSITIEVFYGPQVPASWKGMSVTL